jgi:hypothetical protein
MTTTETKRLERILHEVEEGDIFYFSLFDDTLVISAANGSMVTVTAHMFVRPELRGFGVAFATFEHEFMPPTSGSDPQQLRERADILENLEDRIEGVMVRAHERYSTKRDTLRTILADLSDESPELYVFVEDGDDPHIVVSVGGKGSAFAQAELLVSKLDLHCVDDAKIEYIHPDGPLPDNATPAQLELRAHTLRRLERRIEVAFNRIAVAEECGSLQPQL